MNIIELPCWKYVSILFGFTLYAKTVIPDTLQIIVIYCNMYNIYIYTLYLYIFVDVMEWYGMVLYCMVLFVWYCSVM